MTQKYAKAVVRIGRELAAAMSQTKEEAPIFSKSGFKLSNYSSDYVLGLGVSLGILWECANDKPLGASHQLSVTDLLNWVRDLQRRVEQPIPEFPHITVD